jgi:hypothetical protein
MGIQSGEGAFIVSAYQAAVAGYIGYQNGHKPSLDLLATYSFPAEGEKIFDTPQAKSPFDKLMLGCSLHGQVQSGPSRAVNDLLDEVKASLSQ